MFEDRRGVEMENLPLGSRKQSIQSNAGIATVSAVLMIGILTLDHAFPHGVAIDVLYIAPVLLSLRAQGNRLAVLIAVSCSILIVAGYLISAPGADLWKVIFNRIIAVVAVWVCVLFGLRNKAMAAAREAAVREREKALEEIKILSGLLPICAWCKKVRDDQGYWTQIEAYITSRSQATFSHGICPECKRKHFSEIHPPKTNPDKDVAG